MASRIKWSVDGTLGFYDLLPAYQTKGTLTANDVAKLDSDYNTLNSNPFSSGALNFPQLINLSKLCIRQHSTVSGLTLRYSTDSTDGFDGIWNNLWLGTYTPSANQVMVVEGAPTVVKWLKFTWSSTAWMTVFHVYGEYVIPLFELTDTGGTKFSSDFPLSVGTASNASDYSGQAQFKIKNTDTSAHTYSVSVAKVRYDTDATAQNYGRISKDGGVSKVTSLTTASVGAGSLSETLSMHWDIPKLNNPGDGPHMCYVLVTQV